MEKVSKDAWQEIVGRCEEAGVDAFELNFSCPHGMPERKMGMAMGQDPELLEQVLSQPRCSLTCSICSCRLCALASTVPAW